MGKLEDLKGKRFGSVVIKERASNYVGECDSRIQWIGDCDCGRSVIKCARDYKRSGARNKCYHCGIVARNRSKGAYSFGRNQNGFIDKSIIIHKEKKCQTE